MTLICATCGDIIHEGSDGILYDSSGDPACWGNGNGPHDAEAHSALQLTALIRLLLNSEAASRFEADMTRDAAGGYVFDAEAPDGDRYTVTVAPLT